MANEWYILNNDQVQGPMTDQALRLQGKRGLITPETLVRLGLHGEWCKARLIGNFNWPAPDETHIEMVPLPPDEGGAKRKTVDRAVHREPSEYKSDRNKRNRRRSFTPKELTAARAKCFVFTFVFVAIVMAFLLPIMSLQQNDPRALKAEQSKALSFGKALLVIALWGTAVAAYAGLRHSSCVGWADEICDTSQIGCLFCLGVLCFPQFIAPTILGVWLTAALEEHKIAKNCDGE